MKITIGPVENEYGGAAQHIHNIIKFSKYEIEEIKIPALLQKYSVFFRKWLLPAVKYLPSGLEHSRFRFDMYGWQRHIDLYGQVLANSYSLKFNIVHLHGHPYWESIYQPQKFKCVYTIHNLYSKDDFEPNWHKTIDYLTAKMLKVCKNARVISVAKWLQQDLKKLGVKSTYIPNGVDTNEFLAGNAARFASKYGLRDFYFFVGRLTKYKRPELFVKLAERLKDKPFVMVGKGVTKENLKNYYGKAIPNNLYCLGELPRSDLIDAFKACKVLILPSSNETFGIVILEAMAAGKIPVAANNLGPAEIISNGKDGFLFEPDNIDDLEINAQLAWNNSALGKAGLEKVKSKFDWRRIVPKIEKVYEDLARS